MKTISMPDSMKNEFEELKHSVARKKPIVIKSDIINNYLDLGFNGMQELLRHDDFINLLYIERITSLPRFLAELIKRGES